MDYIDIKHSLYKNNLCDTFPKIREKAKQLGNWDIIEEVENLWTTYQSMMLFSMKGIKDSKAMDIRRSICRDLAIAVGKMERNERMATRGDLKYVSTAKSLRGIQSLEQIANSLEASAVEIERVKSDEAMKDSVRQYEMDKLEKEHEETLLRMFKWVWTSEPWHNSDVHQANRIIFSDNLNSAEKAILISAVSLALQELTDKRKALFLLDCYLIDDALIAQRALVGFILALLTDGTGFYHTDEDFESHLLVYKEDASFIKDFYAVLTQIHMSCKTDSVSSKMLNDILPIISKEVTKRKGKATENQMIDIKELTKNGENPEWLENEKFEKKIREMSDMQLHGEDIYYSSFASMKGYPFFSELPHWFYPYSAEYPLIPEQKKFVNNGIIGKLQNAMLKSSPFCNSDKYSLIFTFNTIGKMGEHFMEEQINEKIAGEENIDDLIENAERDMVKRKDVSRHYIFDLYRFFHSYPYKFQFMNPFKMIADKPVNPFEDKLLADLLTNDEEELQNYADFLMRKEFYEVALDLYKRLAKNEFDEELASVWQKKGFCHQKLGQLNDAVHSYYVANNLKPNSKWTLSHLASLYASNGNHEEARKHYALLLDIEPENIKYLGNCAKAAISLGDYEHAKSLLHKANFLDEESVAIQQELAWCLILNKECDSAFTYINKMLAQNPDDKKTKELYALGMIVSGNTEEGFNRYKELLEEEEITDERLAAITRLKERKVVDETLVDLLIDALKLKI